MIRYYSHPPTPIHIPEHVNVWHKPSLREAMPFLNFMQVHLTMGMTINLKRYSSSLAFPFDFQLITYFICLYFSTIYFGISCLPFWKGNGTPLQYSCLENPMDGGAWWAIVHGVTKSQTRLSDFPFTFHFYALDKEMATHSSVLARRIPGTGEPCGLPSMGSHRVGHNWCDLAAAVYHFNNFLKSDT